MAKRKMLGNMKEFSIVEMCQNNTGKTSASGTMGVLICTVGALSFILGVIAYFVKKVPTSDILVQSIAMVYAGALLLGYRKSTDKVEMQQGIENVPMDPEKPEADEEKPEKTPKLKDDEQINS